MNDTYSNLIKKLCEHTSYGEWTEAMSVLVQLETLDKEAAEVAGTEE
jgi:hypothetical protein